MTLSQWILVFLLLNVFHFLMYWKFYKRAGYPAWKALVPVYNTCVLTKIINRPWWWCVLLYVPIVNLIMAVAYWFQVLEVFGKDTPKDKWLAVLTLGLYIMYLNYTEADQLPYNPEHKKDETFLGAIAFAVVVATIVHTYFFQPFIIPTSSLEKSLLVGDFMFVSKMHYGARAPMTPFAVPMVHDTIPVLKIKSYLNRPQLPYFRFPGWEKPKRFEYVVFNWPADTVERFFTISNKRIRKPIDKKSNYVKRLVGLPGDTIEMRNGILYVNGQKAQYKYRPNLLHYYHVKTKDGVSIPRRVFRHIYEKYDVANPADPENAPIKTRDGYIINLTQDAAEALKKLDEVESVELFLDNEKRPSVFPGDKRWSMDNFGPLYIPKKGDKVMLTKENYPLYKKLLEEYETMQSLKENKVEFKNNTVYINDKPVKEYTFKQDYYWMMGDNRNRSEDSRVWGFVPWTHIIGKPVFIWMSYDTKKGKVRWDRVFTTVHGEGKRQSYLIPFLIFLALIWGYKKWRKKKKLKNG